MSASHAHASQADHDLHLDARSAAAPRPGDAAHAHAPIIGGANPRLAGGVSAPGLLALQRSAGNAAVASLVAPRYLQRDVEIGEVESTVDVADSAPAAPGTGAGAGGAVTSDGATTTITGGVINLDSGMTQTGGVIRAGTIIADSVIAASYSPGAGNVW